MARQGLMDDSGYNFFDVSDCANYESCRAEAEEDAENRMQRILDDEKRLSYEQGKKDAIDEFDSLLYQFGYFDPFAKRLKIYQDDLNRLIQQLKEKNNDSM